MKKTLLSFFIVSALFQSCSNDDDNIGNGNVQAPENYAFTRNGNSTVSYSGQTTRIAMAEELASALLDNTQTQAALDAMFAHQEGNNDFSDANLNSSGKNIRSKTAASTDYFSANSTDANAIKADFDFWIKQQVNEVFPNWSKTATAGNAGQLQEGGGGSTRYINGKGLEYNQAFIKSLIGALMTDQILNNYLSTAVLDAGTNVEDNNNDVLLDGKAYTTMEHKWDEAFGYLYGAEADAANPKLGADSFLNKYLNSVEEDPDFTGIADDIYHAFKLGRAAIVEKNYSVRDEQAEIIKEKISEVIGVRAVYYLQQGKNVLSADKAAAFHDLSEGFGFIYSLQFTRKPNSNDPYFSKSEVDAFLNTLLDNNGFWDVAPETLDVISADIAAQFNFTVDEAKE
ncbi:DUF4856 domain-containing protein [Cognatitamlana onchidii]|uniref:DUF4856 domain-containing protein n=1 Tax=Cognatitamlana onchidii TaxID=2562860 RepID=UPI0010A5C424|nr:DUF4856 domain-containing protein [Algibacter onchidii]